MDAQILTHAIVNHNLVIDGVANDCQQGRNRRQIEVESHQREEANRFGGVEDQCSDRTKREMPFESPPDVKQHGQAGENDREDTRPSQFLTDLWSDDLRTFNLHTRIKLLNRRLDFGDSFSLRDLATLLPLHADKNPVVTTSLLQGDFSETKTLQC